MLWLRRIIAVLLGLIFIVAFIPALVVLRVNGTVGSPGFYADQLRRADVYNFVYTDILPATLERATGSWGTNLSGVKPHLVTIARQVLPPDWLQANTEQVINAVVPYVVGDTRSFTVTVPLKSRVEATARAIKDTLHKPDVFTPLYDQLVGTISETVASSAKGLPLPLSSNDIKAMVRQVFPADWLLKQVDNAIDELVPYVTKDKESFTIRVNLSDRLPQLKQVFTDLLKKSEVYDYLLQELVVKQVKQVQQSAQLPAGITLTDTEIQSLAKQAVTLDWYQARVPEVVGQLFAYLSGQQPNLEVTISIADRKPVIADAVVKLMDPKLESLVNALPACTLSQTASLLLHPPTDSLPPCRPLNMSYADIKKLLGPLFNTLLTRPINEALPSQIRITDSMLGDTGPSNPLTQARAWLTSGFTYTDVQLKASMGASQVDTIRQYIATGFTYTDKDLVNSMGSGQQQFDSVRSTIGTVRRLMWLLWFIPLLLLAATGWLGGRRWSTKLFWAGSVLGAAALLALISFGPVFSATAQPGIDEALAQVANQADAFQAMIAGKGVAIAQNAIGSFIGGLRTQSVILLLVALAITALGFFRYTREKRETQG